MLEKNVCEKLWRCTSCHTLNIFIAIIDNQYKLKELRRKKSRQIKQINKQALKQTNLGKAFLKIRGCSWVSHYTVSNLMTKILETKLQNNHR